MKTGARHLYDICREMKDEKRFVEFKKADSATKGKLFCEALRKIDELEQSSKKQ